MSKKILYILQFRHYSRK